MSVRGSSGGGAVLQTAEREVLVERGARSVMDDWQRLFERAAASDCDRATITDRLDAIRDDD
ncbi:MAG: hypothetical protein ABEI75_05535 [Halobaculum sp.]